MDMRALLNRLTNLEKQPLNEGAKPDFLDMDKDGNKKEPMKKAVTDKKKPEPNKAKKESRGSIAEALMKEMGYDLYERVGPEWLAANKKAKELLAQGMTPEQVAKQLGVQGPNNGMTGSIGGMWGAINSAQQGQGAPAQQSTEPTSGLVSGDGTPVSSGTPGLNWNQPAASTEKPAAGPARDPGTGELKSAAVDLNSPAMSALNQPGVAPTKGNSLSQSPNQEAEINASAAPAAKPGVDTGMTDRNPYDDNALAQQRLDAHQAQQTKYSAQGTPAPAPAPAPAPGKVPNEYEIAQSQGQDPRTPNAPPAPGKMPNEYEIAQSQGQDPRTPNAPPAGGPTNRDSMPFAKAFADAKAKGEKQFTWKGKPYAVKMAEDAELTAMLRIAGLR